MGDELDSLRSFRDDITVSRQARDDARALLVAEIADGQSRESRPTRRRAPRRLASALMVMASMFLALAVVIVVVLVAASVRSPGPPAASPGTPQPLLRILGVLRRPQTRSDLDPQFLQTLRRRGPLAALDGTPIRSLIRLATVTPWGEKVFLVPFRSPNASTIAALPPAMRRFARRRAARLGTADRLGLFAGGGSCCATASEIEQHGTAGWAGGAGSATDFEEVVPDGVSKVSLLLPRQDYPDGPVYPRPLSVSATVHGNVFAVLIHRTVDDPGARQIWYGPTGAVIKRIGATSSHDLNRVVLPPKPAPATALSRRAERDPSTPNAVSVTPTAGGPHTTFTVRFRSLLNGAWYLYRLYGRGGTGCRGRAQLTYGWVQGADINAVRGHIVTTTYAHPGDGVVYVNGRPELPSWCPGAFRVTISATTSPPEGPGPHVTPFGAATFIVHP